MPTNGRKMLHRAFTIQTDYRDSEAQTDPTTLGKSNTQFEFTCEMSYITIVIAIVLLIYLFYFVTPEYAYDYKDVLPEVSALEMLKYGPGGGLPVKDEYDLQNVDRLRYQKMQCDNLPSVQDSSRALVQNRLLGKCIFRIYLFTLNI